MGSYPDALELAVRVVANHALFLMINAGVGLDRDPGICRRITPVLDVDSPEWSRTQWLRAPSSHTAEKRSPKN
jgi:hypothetical protein